METETVTATLDDLEAIACEESFYEFVKAAWHVIEPGKKFRDNWHIRLICDLLERAYRREVRRAIINIPPRCMKSTLVCVLFPVWVWLQDPSTQFLSISHGADLATRDALKSRRLIQSPWFQRLWGASFILTGDQNQKTRYENDKRGYRIAMGITAGITGEGGDIILVDDPHDRNSAHSELERQTAITTYDEAISTRLNDPKTGVIIVIMQRLHVEDLTGHLLAGNERFEHLCLPMEYDPHHPNLSARDERRPGGSHQGQVYLWPDHFTPGVVTELKGRLGPYGAAGQLDQRPSPKGGNIWHEEYFHPCSIEPGFINANGRRVRRRDLHVFNVVDMAYSSKKGADFTAVGTFAGDSTSGELYLIDMLRIRIDVLGTAEGAEHRMFVTDQRKKHNAAYTIVEKAGLASRIIEFLRRDGEPVREVIADRSKTARAYAALPVAEAGALYACTDAPWWPLTLFEMLSFPNGAHDDVPDVVAYGCIHWRDIRTGGGDPWRTALHEALMD